MFVAVFEGKTVDELTDAIAGLPAISSEELLALLGPNQFEVVVVAIDANGAPTSFTPAAAVTGFTRFPGKDAPGGKSRGRISLDTEAKCAARCRALAPQGCNAYACEFEHPQARGPSANPPPLRQFGHSPLLLEAVRQP